MEKLIAVLIAAHLIADFLLQSDWLAKRKGNAGYLLLHPLIHAAMAYAALQVWACWQAPVFILIAYSFIGLVSQRLAKGTARAFVADQTFYVLCLFALGWLLKTYAGQLEFEGIGYKQLIVVAGFIATVQTSGIFIGKFAKQMMDDNHLTLDGLLNGGRLIGQLERALIFLFVFIGQPAGIGFLVAAKSILRFEEAKQQKLAEYVLIGTLLSFSLAVTIASAAKWAAGL